MCDMKRFDFGPHIKALEELERRSVRGELKRLRQMRMGPPTRAQRFMTPAGPNSERGLNMSDDYEIPEILRVQMRQEGPPEEINITGPAPPKMAFELDDEDNLDTDPIAFVIDGKETIVWPLYTRRGSVSVVKSFIPAGLRFPVHTHHEIEVIIVYEGLIRYRSQKLRDRGIDHRDILPGECVRVIEQIPHEVRAVEDSWVIALTIPDNPTLPKKECKSCGDVLEGLDRISRDGDSNA